MASESFNTLVVIIMVLELYSRVAEARSQNAFFQKDKTVNFSLMSRKSSNTDVVVVLVSELYRLVLRAGNRHPII